MYGRYYTCLKLIRSVAIVAIYDVDKLTLLVYNIMYSKDQTTLPTYMYKFPNNVVFNFFVLLPTLGVVIFNLEQKW